MALHNDKFFLPEWQRQVNVERLKIAERIHLFALEWRADKVAILVFVERDAAHVHRLHGIATNLVYDPIIDEFPFPFFAEVPARHIEGISFANSAIDKKAANWYAGKQA